MIAWVHRIGAIEGTSAFALFAVAMPMKYIFDNIGKTEFFWIGLVHGWLWVAYALVATAALVMGHITFRQYFLLFLLSLLPLGPLLGDRYVIGSPTQKDKS